MTIPDTLDALTVPIDDLTTYRRNPRAGNVDAIAESLETNGQFRPIVVNRRTGEVLAGNHTLLAARHLGWTQIAATYVDVDDQQAARIVLADNRLNDLAGYDETMLLDLLRDIDDLAGTGFDEAALAELEAQLATDEEPLTDPDDVPAEPKQPFTRVGQTWILGPHRLVVGDATDPDVLRQALDGKAADLVLTDPPYNVSYTGKTKEALQIEGDDMTDEAFGEFMAAVYAAMFDVTIEGGPIYVFHADSESTVFRRTMVEAGWLLKQCLIWVKDRFVLSRQDYHWQHEPILYGWKPGAAHRWNGGFTPPP